MCFFSSILECYFTFRPRFFTFVVLVKPPFRPAFSFFCSKEYTPLIELNLNSIFSGRESDATQSCNSIELNHFFAIWERASSSFVLKFVKYSFWQSCASKDIRLHWFHSVIQSSPCLDPPTIPPRSHVRIMVGYRLGIDWRKVEPTEINHRI